MRKLVYLLLAVALVFSIASVASAQGPSGVQGTSGVQIVNLDTTEATVTVQYIAEDGTVYNLPDQTIAVGQSVNLYAQPDASASPAGPTTFKGAVIASSDKLISAINKTEWAFGANGAAAYSSASAGATTVTLPLIVVDHFGTTAAVSVQNTDTANAITADIAYTAADGTTFTRQMSIEAGASTSVKLALDADFVDPDTGSAAGWVGSATVTSATPVVAAVHVDNGGNFVYAYNGFTDASQSVNYLPLVRNQYFDLWTGVQVANTNNTAGTLSIEYNGFVDGNGNGAEDAGEAYACTDNSPITAGGSVLFFNGGAFLGTPAGDCAAATTLPAGFVGSATVTASGGANIVTIVNDQAVDGTTSSAYNGFLASDAGETVISPLARAGFVDFFTGLQVQNIGGSEVTATYAMEGFVDANGNFTEDAGEAYSCSESVTIASGASATLVPGLSTQASGNCFNNSTTGTALREFLGSATFTASGGQLVGITNDQYLNFGSSDVRDTAIFNMVSQ